ncbi:MAG: metal-dependent hydrolase, partial [Desulfovibrio sp.]|nr:metal-dependent hydrolase [Desulfovibrio sp.]
FNKIHRGHSHWFGWWALALVAAMAYSPPWLAKDALLGFALGGLSHILLDTLTPQGTPLLPFSHKTRLSLNLCRTGSAGEYIFLVLMIVACAFAYGDAFAHYLEKAAYYLRSMKGIF